MHPNIEGPLESMFESAQCLKRRRPYLKGRYSGPIIEFWLPNEAHPKDGLGDRSTPILA
jgi:hypothetical protein